MDVAVIRRLFEATKRDVRGIDRLLLITDDGFPIVSTLDAGEEEVRTTAVGAILCDSGQRGIAELALGELEAVIVVGDEGYFVLSRIRPGAILMVSASPDVALGMVLLKIRKARPELIRAFGDG
jgi:predicted regulator of Ras-like GTPase activity (Roadblock/LC7/MglB family)